MYKQLIYLVAIMIAFASCSSDDSNTKDEHQSVTVKEVLQTSNYTYLKVDEAGTEKWMAVAQMPVEVGDKYYYHGAIEMNDFESKEMERTFESIFFVDHISTEPCTGDHSHDGHDHSAHSSPHGMGNPHDIDEMVTEQSGKHKPVKKEVDIEMPAGAVSIGELYANRASYVGKTVKVTGVVTKFNAAIMDRNWVHLQDGTEHEGDFDLTVTTLDAVKEGETVVFEGIFATDKDFGFGYFYPVILEESKLK